MKSMKINSPTYSYQGQMTTLREKAFGARERKSGKSWEDTIDLAHSV